MLIHATLNVLPSFRCNSMGDDVVWGRAIHYNASTGSSWSAGERRATVPASNLHHWCLYGHGQVWVPVFNPFCNIWQCFACFFSHSVGPLLVCQLAGLSTTLVQTEISPWLLSFCFIVWGKWCSESSSGDLLTFHLVSQSSQSFYLSNELTQHLFPWHFGHSSSPKDEPNWLWLSWFFLPSTSHSCMMLTFFALKCLITTRCIVWNKH